MIDGIMIRQATKAGAIFWRVGGVADLSFPTSKTRRGRVQENGEVTPTITASAQELCKLERDEMNGYRIRKLTPLECWRLMGFKDEDYKAAESVNSNTQLYAQAGNSIVKNVLEAIFKEMLPDKTEQKEYIEEQEETKITYVCSPYRANTYSGLMRNKAYAQELTRDVLLSGGCPVTPHLYMTQCLDEDIPEERTAGLGAGLELLKHCERVLVGCRFGISEGMAAEIELAKVTGKIIEYRDK